MRVRRSDPHDLYQPEASEGGEETPGYIGMDGRLSGYELENAVARICLGAVQERLPQWGCVHGDGTVVLGRDRFPRGRRVVELKPVFLFEINWADSAPGLSWPVAYYATYIPGYDCWIVTASADSADSLGCADIALGSFRGQDISAGAGRVIRKDWRHARDDWNQSPWAYLFGEGLVSTKEAFAWKQCVWPGSE